MPRNPKVPAIDPVEKDFLDALDRLVRGAPRRPDLVHKHRLGKLRITIAAVAREAGRSRTLIGMDNCAYPRVRAKILGLKAPPARETVTADDIIRNLREEIALLKQEKAKLATQLADAVNRAHRLEKEKKRVERERDRGERRRESPNKVVGLERSGDNVVRLEDR